MGNLGQQPQKETKAKQRWSNAEIGKAVYIHGDVNTDVNEDVNAKRST